jgi:hypothetical protein
MGCDAFAWWAELFAKVLIFLSFWFAAPEVLGP